MPDDKSFEQRAESFANTVLYLTCGSVGAILLALVVLLVILFIAAAIFGGD